MRRLTFWNSGDLKQLKSGIEVILHILICFNGMPMWAYIKDSCKQLFLLQGSMAQSKAVCLDFKSGKPRGSVFEGTSHAVQAAVWRQEINNKQLPQQKRHLKTGNTTGTRTFSWVLVNWPKFAKTDPLRNNLIQSQSKPHQWKQLMGVRWVVSIPTLLWHLPK